MRRTSAKALLAVTAVTALGLPVAGAEARHGADDAPGHVRHSSDDSSRSSHRSSPRSTRRSSRSSRRHRHTGRHHHGAHHRRHGADDGPNHG